jgi:hypothetical protein
MSNKANVRKEVTEPAAATDFTRAPLPMPPYDYQQPDGGTFVIQYDEQRDSQKKVAQEKLPALQNLKLRLFAFFSGWI